MEKLIIDLYCNKKYSLRMIAKNINKNHHYVKRVLLKNNVQIEKGRKEPMTQQHKHNISKACKGRVAWNKGISSNKSAIYKNMATHLRFDIEVDFLEKFNDIEKLKCLNSMISHQRISMNTEMYKEYIIKFYNDFQFNFIYNKWIANNKHKLQKPSLDHIVPITKGGDNSIQNLQVLTWFENRCKNNLFQDEWNEIKDNISSYLI